MAASSILKWQYSLQVGKLLSRYNAASFYLKMAIVTSGVASRAYRTLRGAFLISENGITHFEGQVAGQTYGGFFYLKMAIFDKSKKINII